MSSHTLGHVDCPACEEEKREATKTENLADLTFAEASAAWLEQRRIYLRPRTARDYEQYFRALAIFFGPLKLKDFHIGHIRSYQKWRMENGPVRTDRNAPRQAETGAAATRINNEVRALSAVLNEAGLWSRIKPHFRRVPENYEGPGRALTPEQAKHLFMVAQKNPRWREALWISLAQVHSAIGPGEFRHLKIGDLNLPEAEVTIRRGVKNRFRVRVVALPERAMYAIRKLLDMAREKGATEADHFLLPHRAGKGETGYDPTRPQGHWYGSWRAMVKAAGLPGLRVYDLRHTAITWGLSDPSVPTQAVIDNAGWVNGKMIARYAHMKRAAKKKLASAIGQLDLFAAEVKKPDTPIDDMLAQLKVDPTKLQ